ncbi:hypothetical protein MMC26_007516 [Xylographa opegraphella]|nr:hypothetical protein [Xylographa opegraphella]
MRGLQSVAALLLPVFVTSIALGNEKASVGVPSPIPEVARVEVDGNLNYQPQDGKVTFTIPCLDCSNAERAVLEKAVFTFNIVETKATCTSDSRTSIYEKEIADGEESYRFESSELQIANGIGTADAVGHWSLGCACLHVSQDGSCAMANFVRVLVFRFLNWSTQNTPGFTITYKDLDKPEILRVSLFADADALWDLESSLHWQSPSFMSMPDAPAPKSKIYHSTVTDSTFGLPTASGPLIPTQTRRVMTPLRIITSSVPLPATTQVLDDDDLVQIPLGMQNALRPNHKIQSTRSSENIGNVFVDIETKAKNLFQSTLGDIGYKDNPHFIASTKESVSKQESGIIEAVDGLREITLNAVQSNIPTAAEISAEPPRTLDSAVTEQISQVPPQLHFVRTDQAIRAFQITSLIIIIVSLTTAISVYLFRNPRRRADRAARWEECRRRRLYARAARHHKWKSWMSRVREATRFPKRGQPIAETWEEKQTITAAAEETSIKHMRDELRSLRIAHEVVDGIVNAEEGRSVGISYKSLVRRVERRGSSIYGSDTERTVPPPYEEVFDEEDRVANGFQYIPAGTDCTPDSSVIDTSPRTSIYMRDSDSEKE